MSIGNKKQRNGIDYNQYQFTKLELAAHICLGCGYYFLLGMIFFKHLPLALLACLLVSFHLRVQKKQAIIKRKKHLLETFREAMYALASSLSAGKSVEQAFIASLNDLRSIYNEDEDIMKEWQRIVYKIGMNEPVSLAITDFSERADIEDIHNFNSVFIMAKQSGGNLTQIIKNTIKLINEKNDIQKDIDVLVAQKQYEQKILSYIIPGMILFFWVSSADFLEPLYTTLAGRAVMLLALGMYIVSGVIGKKIVTIEV